jgi:ABC-type glutathione transport system ATPase component
VARTFVDNLAESVTRFGKSRYHAIYPPAPAKIQTAPALDGSRPHEPGASLFHRQTASRELFCGIIDIISLNQPSTLEGLMTARLANRLTQARHQRFVGRSAELELFRAALSRDVPDFAVLHLVGPGGMGKTTLLREFARIAAEAGRPSVALDGRRLPILNPDGIPIEEKFILPSLIVP